jgi:hypothetical protein
LRVKNLGISNTKRRRRRKGRNERNSTRILVTKMEA